MRLCFATNNNHKLEEVSNLLGDQFEIVSLEAVGCKEEIEETGTTLEENSLIKASYIHENFGLDCFADDTGLEVKALNGAPGVYSARYAGEPADSARNTELLLQRLEGVREREARFRTVITLIMGKTVKQFEGIVNGSITTQRSGDLGFGYDPVFLPKGYDRTFAEMPLQEKNTISHRALAIEKLVDYLKSINT